MIKTITKQIAMVVLIAGLLFGASVAHAGFFDWFNNTPLNQEAQALKSVNLQSSTESKSLFERLFGSSTKEDDAATKSITVPVQTQAVNRITNQGTIFNPAPTPASTALIIQCGGSMSVEECEEFCIDIGGNPSASSTGNCVVDNPEDTTLTSGPGTVFNPTPNPEISPRIEFFNNGTCRETIINPQTGNVIATADGVTQTVAGPNGTMYSRCVLNSRSIAPIEIGGGSPDGTVEGFIKENAPFATAKSRVAGPADDIHSAASVVHNDDGTCDVTLRESATGQDVIVSGTTNTVTNSNGWVFFQCVTSIGTFFIDPNPSTNPLPTIPTYEFDSKIELGQTGSDVIKLQNALRSLGYYNGRVDGVYGSGTTAAVKAFQRASGQILTTGNVVGPKTREALNNAVSKAGTATPARSKSQSLQAVFGSDFSNARFQSTCKQETFPFSTITAVTDADPSAGAGSYNIYNTAGELRARCTVSEIQ